MARFIVTDRTCPKIFGEYRPPGSFVDLDRKADYLLIDHLEECETIRSAPAAPAKPRSKKAPVRRATKKTPGRNTAKKT